MGLLGQFYGMLSCGDSSKECGVVGAVLWNLGRCGQFCGMLSCWDGSKNGGQRG